MDKFLLLWKLLYYRKTSEFNQIGFQGGIASSESIYIYIIYINYLKRLFKNNVMLNGFLNSAFSVCAQP